MLKGVKDKERGNLFVAYPDGGKKWRLEAPSTQAKLEWIRTIRAGIERAGADGSSADVAVPDTAAVGQGPATSSSSSLPTAPHKNLFVTELGPGSYFGEMSLVADIPRSATLTAKDRSVLLVLEREAFQSFLNLIPDMKGDIELMAKTRSTQNLRSLKVCTRV